MPARGPCPRPLAALSRRFALRGGASSIFLDELSAQLCSVTNEHPDAAFINSGLLCFRLLLRPAAHHVATRARSFL